MFFNAKLNMQTCSERERANVRERGREREKREERELYQMKKGQKTYFQAGQHPRFISVGFSLQQYKMAACWKINKPSMLPGRLIQETLFHTKHVIPDSFPYKTRHSQYLFEHFYTQAHQHLHLISLGKSILGGHIESLEQ